MDDRPAWARRIRAEREARGWSQADAVRAMMAHSDTALPGAEAMLRSWKRWEAGDSHPDNFYASLIAKTFGTVTAAMFPIARNQEAAVSDANTLDLLTRLRSSTVDDATLDGLRITVDQLCCDYPYLPASQLRAEGRQWLARITTLLDHRLTLSQHREVLTLAGWLALLTGCVEYDNRDRNAEATRQAALSLGRESGNSEIEAWAHEMRAWMTLTQGDYRGVIAAADQGLDSTDPAHGVSVQLLAQKAKAWARVGDRRQVEVALDRGRALLESLPHPGNTSHHFVVDPSKFDFYVMDAYRLLSEDRLAETYAHEVIQASTDHDGHERAPMRIAEARVTLGVVAAREGDLEQAISYGTRALDNDRKCLPTLLMVSRELATVVEDRYGSDPDARAYLDHLRQLKAAV